MSQRKVAFGIRELIPSKRELKMPKWAYEKRVLGFVRSAICWWETLGDRAARGSKRVGGAGVPGIPQQAAVFIVA